jgi:hypothetical protein
MRKIAFLFLTIRDVNFPKIWDKYLAGNEDRYTIYIHPKFPNEAKWHTDRIITNIKETAWGFITRAYMELFKEAIKDKDNFKFITISESCIPIQSFDKLYQAVFADDKSWIKLMKITSYKFEVILKSTPGNFIHHYARMCLNRHHVKRLLVNRDRLEFFHKMHIGDEYFLSILYPLSNYKNIEITYDDWEYVNNQVKQMKNQIRLLYEEQEKNSNIDNKHQINKLQEQIKDIAKNPKSITKVEDDLLKIKESKAFFYRKFTPNSDIEDYWEEIIDYHN